MTYRIYSFYSNYWAGARAAGSFGGGGGGGGLSFAAAMSKQTEITMKPHNTVITLRPATSRPNELSGPAGEAAAVTGLRAAADALSPVGLLNAEGVLPAGYTLMLLDNDVTMVARGRSVSVLNPDGSTSVVAELNAPPLKARKVGDYYVVATEQGCALFGRNDVGSLTHLHQATLLPTLTFDTGERATLRAPIAAVTFDAPYPAWQALLPADERRATAAAAEAWQRLRKRAARAGLFSAPVAVRYSLRLADGSAIYSSAPYIIGALHAPAGTADVSSALDRAEAGTMSAEVFAVKAALTAGIAAVWQPVVSSIDVEIAHLGEVYSPDDATLRCINSGNSHRLESVIAAPSADAVAAILERARWHVAARITDTASPSQLTIYAEASRPEAATAPLGISPIFTRIPDVIERIGGQIALGGGRNKVVNSWQPDFLDSEAVAANYYLAVTLRRGGEERRIVATFRASRSSLRLSPLLAVPFGNATSLEIGMLRAGEVFRFSCPLTTAACGCYSYYAAPGLTPITLAPSSEPYLIPVGQTVTDDCRNALWISRDANPLAQAAEIAVADTRITGIAMAVKQLAANIFGRYPLYVFSDTGIYAVATDVNQPSPRLIARLRVARQEQIAMLGETVLLVADSALYTLRNGRLAKLLPEWDATELHAVESKGEVWCQMAYGDTRVVALDGSYFTSRETIAALAEGAGVVGGGKITTFGETFPSPLAVSYLSHPFKVAGAPRWLQWDSFGDGLSLTFTLRAAEGNELRGPVLNSVRVEGSLDRPLRIPLRVPPIYHTFRLEISGYMCRGSLLRPVKLSERLPLDDYPLQ